MTEIGAREMTTRLPELLDRVGQGEEIVITRDGTPAARLVPARGVPQPPAKRATAEELLEIARQFRSQVKGDFSSQDINDILYDEDRLPK